MLEPAAVSDLIGQRVESVRRLPFSTKGFSSTEAQFEGVELNGEAIPSLVMKTIDRATGWVSVATRDDVDRELATWESGLLDLLPAEMGYAVVSGARFPGGSSLLMRNLVSSFITDDAVTHDWHNGVLRSLAAMHAAYCRHPVLDKPGLKLCALEQLMGHLSPAVVPDLERAVPDHFIIGLITEGWSALPALVGDGLTNELLSLAVDPGPVSRFFVGHPRTLVHGDVRPANVAFDGRRVTLVDWARPTAGPPGIDLVYYLLMAPPSQSVSPDIVADGYRSMLADSLGGDVSMSWWADHLDVCFTAVFAMMAAIQVNYELEDATDDHPAHAGIEWWAERAKPGLRILGRS